MRKHTTWQFFKFYFSIQATNPDTETTEPSSLYISHQFFLPHSLLVPLQEELLL